MEENNFYQQVYELARMIPQGRITSYGAIAKALGRPGAARIVGYAMGQAGKADPPVPAHRVLNHKGELTAKEAFGKGNRMQELLEKEGLTIKNNKIVNFNRFFWNPLEELD